MRCNLFKTLGSGDSRVGEFLMFSQYTEDITKEQSMKSTYRVIPSKFVVLDLNINRAFNDIDPNSIPVSSPINFDSGTHDYYMMVGDKRVDGRNNIISQIFQSYFENANAFIRNHAGEEDFPVSEWDVENRNYATELLWRTLEEWGFIHKKTIGNDFICYDEIKYIGDINIHSNHKAGSYSYDEVFCHIPTGEDEYYYRLNRSIEIQGVPYSEEMGGNINSPLEGWTDITYPESSELANRVITYHDPTDDLGYYYRIGGDFPELEFKGKIDPEDFTPIPRHPEPLNDEYNFNAIIVFYDVLYTEPGEDPRYLYKGRPMGIYLSGAVNDNDDHRTNGLLNTFTKFISNNDAYGQGASFGLRILMRYTPTPNNSAYVIGTSDDGHDYETITEAMGSIVDAIVGINRMYKDQHIMYQTFKDHLSEFRNRRVNIPYVRKVGGIPYWFVNGRNTGQPVYYQGRDPEREYTREEILGSVSVAPEGSVTMDLDDISNTNE